MREVFWWLGVACVFALDRFSKIWIQANLVTQDLLPVCPGLQFVHQNNRGMAMGLFHHASSGTQSLLYLVVGCLVLGVVWQFVLLRQATFKLRLPWALLLAGALGNFWDRLMYGSVLDFIDVFWGHWHYYTFNIADVAISLAVLILLWQSFFEPPQHKGQGQ